MEHWPIFLENHQFGMVHNYVAIRIWVQSINLSISLSIGVEFETCVLFSFVVSAETGGD